MEAPASQARIDQTKRLSNHPAPNGGERHPVLVIYLVLYGGFMTVFGSTVSGCRLSCSTTTTLHTMLASTFMICSAIGYVLEHRARGALGHQPETCATSTCCSSMSDILAKSDGPVMPSELRRPRHGAQHHQGRLRAEQACREAAEEPQEQAGGITWRDIKTPLTSIIGYLTLLEESPDHRSTCAPATRTSRWTKPTGSNFARRVLRDHALQPYQAIPIERSRFDGALLK